jgi:hypothetical protein
MRAAFGGFALVLLALAPRTGLAGEKPADYETPEAAAQALLDALATEDMNAILEVLGTEFKDELFPEGEVVDRESLQKIVAAAKEVIQLREDDADTRVMVIGTNAWPLPFPIVRDASGWHIDTNAGLDEVYARRIGQNELSAIDSLRAYVDAQVQYSGADRDADDVLEYAQKFISDSGLKNGLYWKDDGGDASPFGPFVAELPDYAKHVEPGDPFMGYYFRILTRQGENAPGGRYDYVINGNMIAGFAAIAVPAEYGQSGIMTFVVSHRGRVYERDLGEDTTLAAAAIQDYNPDGAWALVEDE